MNDTSRSNDSGEMKFVELTVAVVSAYVSNNAVSIADLPNLIGEVHAAFGKVKTGQTVPPQEPKPAVPPRKSVFDDYIICLEDGKRFKSLKRHLRTQFGLCPDEYRAKWGLSPDYPMVAPSYAEIRSKLALENGLGRKPGNGKKKR